MKIKLVIIALVLLGITACENQEFTVRDFDSTSVFFPYQTPARTLLLGNYDLGFNDNDNNGKFEIGVVMSGVFENTEDRKVHFELAPELIDATTLGVDSVNVQLLPATHYTIEKESPVTIPSGSINGRIPIQLNDAFFDDPLSIAPEGTTHYVIPLKITDFENLDSLLTGVPIVDNPTKVLTTDYSSAPKDYTLFGIKYINEYHGKYLRRGADKVSGSLTEETPSNGNVVTTIIDTTSVYSNEFIERDEIATVLTSGRNKATVSNLVRRGKFDAAQNDINIEMTVADNGDIVITEAEGETRSVTGTGKWLEDGDEWGGDKRDVIYLEYQYQDIGIEETKLFGRVINRKTIDLTHTVKDTLVIRNRDFRFEQFTLELIQNP